MIGKSPLFEIRHMECEANSSLKSIPSPEKNHLKEPELDDNEGRRFQLESDEEDGDYSPIKKLSRKRTVSKRRSPLYLYTYKVYCSWLKFPFSFVPVSNFFHLSKGTSYMWNEMPMLN